MKSALPLRPNCSHHQVPTTITTYTSPHHHSQNFFLMPATSNTSTPSPDSPRISPPRPQKSISHSHALTAAHSIELEPSKFQALLFSASLNLLGPQQPQKTMPFEPHCSLQYCYPPGSSSSRGTTEQSIRGDHTLLFEPSTVGKGRKSHCLEEGGRHCGLVADTCCWLLLVPLGLGLAAGGRSYYILHGHYEQPCAGHPLSGLGSK
jgi:hypothetical protein